MIYYNKENILIRDSKKEDIGYIADNMRRSDIDEIWASNNRLPKEALDIGFKDSLKCITGLKDNIPVCIFGINPDSILGRSAVIWFLATPNIIDNKYIFLRQSRKFIDMFLEEYSFLYNFVDDRNKDSIKWLKWCGARINGCVTYGVEKIDFHPFTFEKYRRNYV